MYGNVPRIFFITFTLQPQSPCFFHFSITFTISNNIQGALLSAFAFIRERGAELYSAWSAVLLFSLSATGYLAPSFAPTRWSAEAVPSFVLCRAGIMYDSGNFITSNCLFLHYFGPLRRNSSPAWLTVLVIVRLMFNRTSVTCIYFSSFLASCSNGNFITLNCFFLWHLDFT